MREIRALTAADQRAVGRIAYQTGFFGDSAERYFPCQPLFERLWVGPYFSGPGLGFVAVLDGQTVGYIVGMSSEAAYTRALGQQIAGLWRGLPCPGAAWQESVAFLLRMKRYGGPHVDTRQYPAHLHINLLPQARGHGLGAALLQAYLHEIRRRGVRGVYLSTTAENRAALRLYRSFGFEVLASQTTNLWTPWLGYPTEQLVWGLRLD